MRIVPVVVSTAIFLLLPVLCMSQSAPFQSYATFLGGSHSDWASSIAVDTDGNVYVHDISAPTWYKEVPGLSGVEIDPDLITVSSDIYRIVALAALDEMKVELTAVVQREQQQKTGKWICRILSWEAE